MTLCRETPRKQIVLDRISREIEDSRDIQIESAVILEDSHVEKLLEKYNVLDRDSY